MEWGILIVGIIFLVVAYVVVQGTRAAHAWRRAAADGDLEVIRRIVEEAFEAWRSVRRPKDVSPEVWRGIQTAELMDVGPDFLHVSCRAESEYRLLGGRWVETASPLQDGMAITVRLADMLLYELPHFRPERVQIDVYTAFRAPDGSARQQRILSTSASRDAARQVDWEEWSPARIVEAFGGRYRLGVSGEPLPLDDEGNATLGPGGDGFQAAIGP